MNLKYSSRDKTVNQALKHQPPICTISYDDVLGLLIRHFQSTGKIPNEKRGYVVGLNPYEQSFEVHSMPKNVWKKVISKRK